MNQRCTIYYSFCEILNNYTYKINIIRIYNTVQILLMYKYIVPLIKHIIIF